MRALVEVVRSGMRGARRSGIIWAVVIGLLVFVTIAFWPAFQGTSGISQAIEQLPSGVVQAFGLQDFGSPAGFLRGNLYDFIVPLLLAGAAVGIANGLTASDEDAGRLELVLVQPVNRVAVFGGRALAAALWTLVIGVVLFAVQLASDQAFGLPIGTDRILPTLVLVLLLGAFHGGLTLLVAGFAPRPSLAMGVGLGIAVAGLTVSALFPISATLKPYVGISPWNWALGHDPLTAPTEAWRYAALGLPAIAFAILGMVGFARRDVRSA
jgi:ABC-2 type transport system permease protein